MHEESASGLSGLLQLTLPKRKERSDFTLLFTNYLLVINLVFQIRLVHLCGRMAAPLVCQGFFDRMR